MIAFAAGSAFAVPAEYSSDRRNTITEIELIPNLVQGKLTKVSDAGVSIELRGRMGLLNVPARCVVTSSKLEVGDTVELYLSYARKLEPQNSAV